jgi:NADP-reducing hydrogenase subunit HndB
MEHIRSIEELTEARKEALDRETIHTERYPIQIRISMGSCGIAAGANETLEAIDQFIKENNLEGVQVKQIGCLGLCALEPIVQVVELGGQHITYGRVDPAVVRRIFHEHIEKHLIVQEYMVETN